MVLPDFISTAITTQNTSVGKNKAFHDMCVQLTQKLLEDRYGQVIDAVEKRYGYVPTTDEAFARLSRLIRKTLELEKPLRSQLETLCEATVNKALGVPQETVLLNCELVDSIKPGKGLRIVPETDDKPEYSFKDVTLDANDEILRRRLTDSLVQGISYLLMTATYDSDAIREWSADLPSLYGEILCLNDFLLFSKEEDVTDDKPMLGAYVLTDIGQPDEKVVIDSQGLVYPLLLQETYRGFFEMFATHGLPDDIKDAMYIIRRADFTLAEAWDLRLGVPMWQYIDKMIPDTVETAMYPYIFSSLMSETTEEFNTTIFDCLTHVEGRKNWFADIVRKIKHDREYELFKKDIEKFNLEKCLIVDDNNNENII